MSYTIKSSWNAIANGLNGTTYDTLDAALWMLRQPRWLGPDAVTVEGGAGEIMVYADQERADRDADGSRCHAVIEEVRS